MVSISAIDRAFDLAKSGQYRSVSEIIRRLSVDDRAAIEAHLALPQVRRELILTCGNAWLSRD
jgi:Arc/MetJ-type ribon-helix-helix transcriptional regulator